MKQLRQFCAAATLTLAISITALAGDIDSPTVANPLPSTEVTTSSAAAGSSTLSADSTTDLVTDFTLSLFAQLLSVL